MLDEELRQLEAELKATPEDLNLRIRVLRTYLRIGTLNSSGLADLAALDDPGAIAILGRNPGLNSRTKKFYLRCALIVLHQIFEQLTLLQMETDARRVQREADAENLSGEIEIEAGLIELHQQIFDAVEVFQKLMMDYLNFNRKSMSPLKYFRSGNQASLKEFRVIFNTLAARLQNYSLHLMDLIEDPVMANQSLRMLSVLSNCLIGYEYLAAAFNDDVKVNTDQALNSAVRAWDHFNQGGLLPRTPTYEASLPNLSLRLLAQNQARIIKSWLPNYQP